MVQGNILFHSIKLQRIPKNNATSRVYPYGVVFNTILHSIIIHSIGVHNETANKSNLHDANFWQIAKSENSQNSPIWHNRC